MAATEWISGNVFIRPMADAVEPGFIIQGHTHNFDHTSIFFTGRWLVRKWMPVDGGESDTWLRVADFEREAPFHLLIESHAKHEFTFLGPGLGRAWCVYSHRGPQGEVTEHRTGWEKAYN